MLELERETRFELVNRNSSSEQHLTGPVLVSFSLVMHSADPFLLALVSNDTSFVLECDERLFQCPQLLALPLPLQRFYHSQEVVFC